VGLFQAAVLPSPGFPRHSASTSPLPPRNPSGLRSHVSGSIRTHACPRLPPDSPTPRPLEQWLSQSR
jgi:hypothetical protein